MICHYLKLLVVMGSLLLRSHLIFLPLLLVFVAHQIIVRCYPSKIFLLFSPLYLIYKIILLGVQLLTISFLFMLTRPVRVSNHRTIICYLYKYDNDIPLVKVECDRFDASVFVDFVRKLFTDEFDYMVIEPPYEFESSFEF